MNEHRCPKEIEHLCTICTPKFGSDWKSIPISLQKVEEFLDSKRVSK